MFVYTLDLIRQLNLRGTERERPRRFERERDAVDKKVELNLKPRQRKYNPFIVKLILSFDNLRNSNQLHILYIQN